MLADDGVEHSFNEGSEKKIGFGERHPILCLYIVCLLPLVYGPLLLIFSFSHVAQWFVKLLIAPKGDRS